MAFCSAVSSASVLFLFCFWYCWVGGGMHGVRGWRDGTGQWLGQQKNRWIYRTNHPHNDTTTHASFTNKNGRAGATDRWWRSWRSGGPSGRTPAPPGSKKSFGGCCWSGFVRLRVRHNVPHPSSQGVVVYHIQQSEATGPDQIKTKHTPPPHPKKSTQKINTDKPTNQPCSPGSPAPWPARGRGAAPRA